MRHDLRMPRGSGLTDTGPQIDDVIAWLQSLWPDEAYSAWYEIQANAARR